MYIMYVDMVSCLWAVYVNVDGMCGMQRKCVCARACVHRCKMCVYEVSGLVCVPSSQ